MKTLLIIPVYNEEENIANLLERLQSEFSHFDFIIVNDGSTDNTMTIIRSISDRYLDLPVNLGIGGAVQTGFIYALRNGFDIAIQYDGDGQHDPAYLDVLVKEIERGYDLVIGSRFIKGDSFRSSFIRRLGIMVIRFLCRLTIKQKITDPTSGFRACNRRCIEFFAANYPKDYPEPESLVKLKRAGFSIAEIAVSMNERTGGVSSITPLKSLYYMVSVSMAMIIGSGIKSK